MRNRETLDDFKRADVFDSRDVIARVEALEDERDAHVSTCGPCDGNGAIESDETAERSVSVRETIPCEACAGDGTIPDPAAWATENPDDAAELAALVAFRDEAEGYSDWHHGAGFIADHYFETYARDLAEDIGAIGKDLQWPACHIDWEAAADALKMDYSCITLDGVDFWVRD